MNIKPLIGMMRAPQIYLAPDGAGGNGGAATQDPKDDDDNIDLGLDPDLLDDESRVKYEDHKKKLQGLQTRLKEAKTTKELLDRVQAELEQLKQGQHQQHRQQQQQTEEQTFEQEMVELYVAQGLSREDATKAAKVNAPIFGKFAERVTGHMGETLAPVASQVVQGRLTQDFSTLQTQDWRVSIPDIAEDVWQKSQNIAKSGGQVSLPVMQNLLKIAYVDFMDKNPDYEFEGGQPPRQPQQQQQQQRPPMNNGTRFTFPGAGHNPQGPRQTTRTTPSDPAIDAAMANIKQHWKGWQPAGVPTPPKITLR